ncbi:ferric reductase [Geopyxis carbonaria]|nr:ferric reductase [Geopyxis carbonaria]
MVVSLTKPIKLHSMRHDMCELTPEQCAWKSQKWLDWYHADRDYAQSTVYFMVAMIGFFGICNALSRGGIKHRKVLAAWRWASYRNYRARSWYSPPAGIVGLGLAGAVFVAGLLLAAQPYYWPNTKVPKLSYGNSPPIATRAGWMAVALLPFVIAFASKWNFVTFITGVSHEKLQVFHRWTSWAMYVLALVHTFPFIVFHIWKGDMMMQYKTTIWYWSGIAALLPQTWLTILSLGPVRNRYYEFFKSMHYVMTILFVVFFFLHCNFRLSSWDYFIATAVVYGLSLFASWGKTYLQPSHTAVLESLGERMVRVTVPTSMKWRPAQHVFLRFTTMGAHSATSHPFTICSLPAPTSSKEPGAGPSELKFYIRPHGGLTGRLGTVAEGRPGSAMPVTLEGPYGGLTKDLGKFERVLVVAGGSGASLIVPVLESVGGRVPVHVIWCVKTSAALSWPSADFLRLSSATTTVSVYITGGQLNTEKNIAAMSATPGVDVNATGCRPDLAALIRTEAAAVKSMALAACGPASLLFDVQNAAAGLQLRILAGTAGPLEEVYLHAEHFAW